MELMMAEGNKATKIVDIGEVTVGDERLSVLVSRYADGGQIFVGLQVKETGEPYTVLSTNLRAYGADVAKDEIAVKTWFENEHLVEAMLQSGLFEDTGRRVQAGFAEAQVWRFKSPAHVPAGVFSDPVVAERSSCVD
jgi:hypothetical protein